MSTGNRLDELIPVVDEDGVVLRWASKEACHRGACASLPLHGAFSLLVVAGAGRRMLLQRRAASKHTFAGLWTNAVCSHPTPADLGGGGVSDFVGRVLPDPVVLNAVRRRAAEELGLRIAGDSSDLKVVGRVAYAAQSCPQWGEHELDSVVLLELDDEPRLSPDPCEASDVRWMSRAEVLESIAADPCAYTPWFRAIASLADAQWRFRDADSIVRLGAIE